jgi:hypothetical protein
MTYFDVAVDSDNNGFIEHSDLENFLESHEYGLGKIIDVKENQYITTNTQLIPIQITVPNFIKYERSEYGLTFSPANHIIYYKKTGRNQYTRIDDIRYSYESFGMPIDDEYLWDENGHMTIYASMSYSVNSRTSYVDLDNRTYRDAEVSGKPTQYLEITLVKIHKTTHFIDHVIESDVIRYISIDPDKGSFYEELQSNDDLRYAIAASQVYGRNDAPEFCLQLLGEEELKGLGIQDKEIINLLINGGKNNSQAKKIGFNAGIYRGDFINQKYILAYEGTNSGSDGINLDLLVDWLTNMSNGVGLAVGPYQNAINIACYIQGEHNSQKIIPTGNKPPVKMIDDDRPSNEQLKENIILVGHSMGGGLASVASVASTLPATIFNPAGINPYLFGSIVDAMVPTLGGGTDYTQYLRKRAIAYVQNEQAETSQIRKITTKWDILTNIQIFVNINFNGNFGISPNIINVNFDLLPNGVGTLPISYSSPLLTQNDSSYNYAKFLSFLQKINTMINTKGHSVINEFWPKLLQFGIGSTIFGPSWLASELAITVSEAIEMKQIFSHAIAAHSTKQIIFGLLGQDLFGYYS